MTRSNAPTCYLCCASAAYVDYAREELRNFEGGPATKLGLQVVLKLAGPVVRATGSIIRCSRTTGCSRPTSGAGSRVPRSKKVTAELLKSWPGRAIVWRSLNELTDAEVIADFVSAGYPMFPARQVYIFDCRDRRPPQHRDEKRDLAVLARADYRLRATEELHAEDFARIEALYAKLYLQKYTPLNPQYGARLLERLHEAGILNLFGLRGADGLLDGVIGFFEQGGRDDGAGRRLRHGARSGNGPLSHG